MYEFKALNFNWLLIKNQTLKSNMNYFIVESMLHGTCLRCLFIEVLLGRTIVLPNILTLWWQEPNANEDITATNTFQTAKSHLLWTITWGCILSAQLCPSFKLNLKCAWNDASLCIKMYNSCHVFSFTLLLSFFFIWTNCHIFSSIVNVGQGTCPRQPLLPFYLTSLQ